MRRLGACPSFNRDPESAATADSGTCRSLCWQPTAGSAFCATSRAATSSKVVARYVTPRKRAPRREVAGSAHDNAMPIAATSLWVAVKRAESAARPEQFTFQNGMRTQGWSSQNRSGTSETTPERKVVQRGSNGVQAHNARATGDSSAKGHSGSGGNRCGHGAEGHNPHDAHGAHVGRRSQSKRAGPQRRPPRVQKQGVS